MDSMVTARMAAGKKEQGARALKNLGMSPSSAINCFYDYVIEYGALPFLEEVRLTQDDILARIALVDGIPLEWDNRFASMSDDEIRSERLGLTL